MERIVHPWVCLLIARLLLQQPVNALHVSNTQLDLRMDLQYGMRRGGGQAAGRHILGWERITQGSAVDVHCGTSSATDKVRSCSYTPPLARSRRVKSAWSAEAVRKPMSVRAEHWHARAQHSPTNPPGALLPTINSRPKGPSAWCAFHFTVSHPKP